MAIMWRGNDNRDCRIHRKHLENKEVYHFAKHCRSILRYIVFLKIKNSTYGENVKAYLLQKKYAHLQHVHKGNYIEHIKEK